MRTLILRAVTQACVVSLLAVLIFLPMSGQAAEPAAGETTPEARAQRLEEARQRLEQAAREVAELSLDESGRRDVLMLRNLAPGRAALGINIARADAERGEAAADEGVPVLSVSPGGPAAQAGLRAGDILLSVDGRALRRENGRSPQAVLLAFMESVEPGQSVAVEYRRDGRAARANVIAQALDPGFMAGTRIGPMIERVLPPGAMERAIGVFRGSNLFGAVELVPLTPKLGQYFGTDTGLLVVRAPADSRLGLEEGDVILDIAGRVPTSPSHAMRILDSYQPGEKLVLTVMRQRKRLPLDVEVPQPDRRGGPVLMQPFQRTVPATPGMPVPAAPEVRPLPGTRDRA